MVYARTEVFDFENPTLIDSLASSAAPKCESHFMHDVKAKIIPKSQLLRGATSANAAKTVGERYN